MGKILLGLLLFVSMLFAQLDLNTASKAELMQIKGIGSKKADAIINYRKTKTIKSAEELKNIKGFGKAIISNVKNGIKVSVKKSKKKTSSSKAMKKKEQKLKNKQS